MRPSAHRFTARVSLLGAVLFALTVSPSPSAEVETEVETEIVRTWTGTTGTGFEGKLLEYSEEKVVLRRTSDGRQFTIPLERLIEADRDFIAALLRNAERDSLLKDGPYSSWITGTFEPDEFENGMLFNLWGSPEFDPTKRYPLVIFLHGIDLRGSDNEKPLSHGAAKILVQEERQAKWPCFVVIPQCPASKNWAGEEFDKLHALAKDLVEFLPIDEKRVYLAGNDMGAHGVWYGLETYPDFFAAATVVGGAGNPAVAEKIKHIPTASVCGENDANRIERMRAMADAFAATGASDATFTAIPDLTWVSPQAWLNEERITWLFEQIRQPRKTAGDDQ